MPNTRSAKKRMRQARKANVQNRAARSALRTAVKRVRTAPPESAESAYRQAAKLLDRAARRGLIHKNAAARSKRRLQRVASQKG